jgi:hypothetical protein
VGSGATLAQEVSGPPTLALARDGKTAYVAWLERSDSTSNVVLEAVTPAGRQLRAPVRVNATPGDASTHDQAPPQVALGPRGEVYVVWQKSTPVPGRAFPRSDLRFAASTDGGRTFGPTITVNDDAGGPPSSHTVHNVVVAPDGRVIVSWLDARVRDRARAALEASGRLQPEAPASHSHGETMRAHEASAAEASLPGSEIRAASWSPGDPSFSPSTVVDGNTCPCCRTAMAIGPEGTLFVAWRKVYPGNVRDVVVARSTDGGRSFSAPVRVHADGWVYDGCPHAGPGLAVDAAGKVYAGWYTGKEGAQGLYVARSGDGGRSFGEPLPLLRADWVPPSQVKLAAAGDRVWASWDDRRPSRKVVHLARVDGGTLREVGEPVPGSSPALDVGHDGGCLAWLDGDSVRMRTLEAER